MSKLKNLIEKIKIRLFTCNKKEPQPAETGGAIDESKPAETESSSEQPRANKKCCKKNDNLLDIEFQTTLEQDIEDSYNTYIDEFKIEITKLNDTLTKNSTENETDHYKRIKKGVVSHINSANKLLTYLEDTQTKVNFKSHWAFVANEKRKPWIELLKKEKRCRSICLIIVDIIISAFVIALSFLPSITEIKSDKLYPYITIYMVAIALQIVSILYAIKTSIHKFKAIKIIDATIFKLKMHVTVTYDELRRDINELL